MKTLARLICGVILVLLSACGQSETPPAPVPTVTSLVLPTAEPPTANPTNTLAPKKLPTTGPSRLAIFHRAGQTFLTWPERSDLTGERYRVYRSRQPITAENLAQAKLLAQVGKHSARVWANYYFSNGERYIRLTERFILKDGAPALAEGLGALVWTLAPEDFDGQTSGNGYYAVTVIQPGDVAVEVIAPDMVIGPVQEAVGIPRPVEITGSPGIKSGQGAHYYLQYLDLRKINPTYHAPNKINKYYGYQPSDPGIADALAYTFDYYVFEPTEKLCGGQVPDSLPVMIFLHGHRNNRYTDIQDYPYPFCAYGLYPIDESETWYFGFARQHDYRGDSPFFSGDVIENYTEQRVLRMLYDLMRNPPADAAVDPRRIYLFGHSMGGTGALAFAQRYPNIFAAIYSGQPVTHFRVLEGDQHSWNRDVAPKWGSEDLNLPIAINAPNHWADHLQKYNGLGVYDWEDLRTAFDPKASPDRSGEDMVPFGVDHGTIDDAVAFATQGKWIYPLLHRSPRAWAGAITESPHTWSNFAFPPVSMRKVKGAPFWGLTVVRDETVPGLSNLSVDSQEMPAGPTEYNQSILWSASWDAWDGPPIDEPDHWQMSLCTVRVGARKCGGTDAQTVDITPRRVQHFIIRPGQAYDWVSYQVANGRVLARGKVIASANGVLTIPRVRILTTGTRLDIHPRGAGN